MNRAGIAVLLAAALGLAGCAGTGPEESAAAPGDMAAAQLVSGTWRVTGARTGAGSTLPAETAGAFVGTTVEIGPERVVGVRGNRCDVPAFAGSITPPADFFAGTGVDPVAFGITQPTAEVITVTCGGMPFDRFLRLADGSLVTGFDGAVFRLEKAGAAARSAASAPTAPPAAAGSAATRPGEPAHAAHLASYRHGSDAERGWQILSARYPELRRMTAVYTEVTVAGRGTYHRLLVAGESAAAITALCLRLRQAGQYCAPMPLGSAASHAATAAETARAAPVAPPAPAAAPSAAPAAGPPMALTAAPVAAAAAGPTLTRDYITGVWAFDGVAGCSGDNVLSLLPDGSVRLYNRLGGVWRIEDGAVRMVVQAIDPSGAATDADVAMEMRPIALRPDGFRATFSANGRTAEMAAARCPR